MSRTRHVECQDIGKMLNDIKQLERMVNDFDMTNEDGSLNLNKYKKLMSLNNVLQDWKYMAWKLGVAL